MLHPIIWAGGRDNIQPLLSFHQKQEQEQDHNQVFVGEKSQPNISLES
jgi:hypothetical protein